MVKAMVLIKVKTGQEDKILNSLKTVEGLVKLYVAYGMYDIVVIIEAENEKELQEIIMFKLGKLEGIEFTPALIVVEVEFEKRPEKSTIQTSQ